MKRIGNADLETRVQQPTSATHRWGRAMLEALADAREILAARSTAVIPQGTAVEKLRIVPFSTAEKRTCTTRSSSAPGTTV